MAEASPQVVISAVQAGDFRDFRRAVFDESVRLRDGFLPMVEEFQARDQGQASFGSRVTATEQPDVPYDLYVARDPASGILLGAAEVAVLRAKDARRIAGIVGPAAVLSSWRIRSAPQGTGLALIHSAAARGDQILADEPQWGHLAIVSDTNAASHAMCTKLGLQPSRAVTPRQIRGTFGRGHVRVARTAWTKQFAES